MMLWLALLSLCLALASGHLEKEDKHVQEIVHEYKTKAQRLFLNHLGDKLTDIREQLKRSGGLEHDHHEKLSEELHARLDHLEEDECDEGTHHCGLGSEQCVHELLFCDGHYDCYNHADENKDLCSGHAVAVGSSFHGLPTWENCHTHNHNEILSFTISHKKVSPYHGAKVEVQASLSWSPTDHDAAHGSWSVGGRTLTLDAKGEHLHLECHFLTDDVADCEVKRSPDHLCATVRVHRS